MSSSKPEEQDLTVAVEGGRLVISIGIKALSVVALTGDYFGAHPADAITDVPGFAEEVRRQLLREQEDGTTLVHEMLDRAAQAVNEDGFEGIKEPIDEDGDDEFEGCSMSNSTPAPVVWQTARYLSVGATAAEKAFLGPDELYELVVLRMPSCQGYPAYCRWEVWGPPLHGKLLAAGEAETPETAKLMAEAYVLRVMATVQLSAGQSDVPAPGKAA